MEASTHANTWRGQAYALCLRKRYSPKMLTQPYAIQVFAYAQSPYEHVLTKYEHLGFERCSIAINVGVRAKSESA